jgi:hypothetical protein
MKYLPSKRRESLRRTFKSHTDQVSMYQLSKSNTRRAKTTKTRILTNKMGKEKMLIKIRQTWNNKMVIKKR